MTPQTNTQKPPRPYRHGGRKPASLTASRHHPWRRTLLSVAGITLLAYLQPGLFLLPQAHAEPANAAVDANFVKVFDIRIEAQPIASALAEISRQTGTQILANGELVANRPGAALSGTMSVEEALHRLLYGTGLHATVQQPGIITVVDATARQAPAPSAAAVLPNANVQMLGEILVTANADSHEQRQFDTYYAPESRTYLDEAYIQRFKGTNAADMFFGLPGVGSADSRNGNAVSINIRGIEGAGRVPLTVDGTEQSTVIYRGYAGSINRNYIDPALISSTEIIKGPTASTNFRSGNGGAVVMQTIGVNDIVQPGKKYGLRLTGSINNNSISPRIKPGINTPGLDPEFHIHPETGNPIHSAYYYVRPKNREGQSGNFRDHAGSIAWGWRGEQANAVLAYSHREQGNYFSGKKGADRYYDFATLSDQEGIRSSEKTWADGWVLRMNNPGHEVPNTSSKTTTVLAKSEVKLTPDQKIKASYRHTASDFGSIMPSHYNPRYYNSSWDPSDYIGLPQEPLSTYRMHAATLDYKLNPETNHWLDLDIGLWANRTLMRGREGASTIGQPLYEWRVNPETGLREYIPQYNAETGQPYYEDDAAFPNHNSRWGVNLSNRMQLAHNLSLALGVNFEKEKSYPGDMSAYQQMMQEKLLFHTYSQLRDGKRNFTKAQAIVEWQPTSWLEISAAATFQHHNFRDNYLSQQAQENPEGMLLSHSTQRGIDVSHFIQRKPSSSVSDWNYGGPRSDLPDGMTAGEFLDEYLFWKPRADGKFYHEDREAMLDVGLARLAEAHKTSTWEYFPGIDGFPPVITYTPHLARRTPLDELRRSAANPLGGGAWPEVSTNRTDNSMYTPPANGSASAWGGMLSATIHWNERTSSYIRYADQPRMPNLLESLYGFGKFSRPPISFTNRLHKPERTHNLEVGATHDFSRWLPRGNGIIKLAWYNTRSTDFKVPGSTARGYVDEIKMRGWELNAQVDTGQFFATLGGNYNQHFTVCDQVLGYAFWALDDRYVCVAHGHTRDLRFLKPPKKTINLGLGTRLLERKLTLGSRFTYIDGHGNRPGPLIQEGAYLDYDSGPGGAGLAAIYPPSVTVMDLYANYQFNKSMSFDVTVANATDRFYIDAYSRTKMASPGRTITISVKGVF